MIIFLCTRFFLSVTPQLRATYAGQRLPTSKACYHAPELLAFFFFFFLLFLYSLFFTRLRFYCAYKGVYQSYNSTR